MRRILAVAVATACAFACGAFGSDGDAEDEPSTPDGGGVGADGGPTNVDANGPGPADPDGGTETNDGQAPVAEDFPTAVRKLPGLIAYWRLTNVSPEAPDEQKAFPAKVLGRVQIAGDLLPGATTDAGAVQTTVLRADSEGKLSTAFSGALTVGLLLKRLASSQPLAQTMLVQKEATFALGLRVDGHPTFDLAKVSQQMTGDHPIAVGDRTLLVATFDATTQRIFVNEKLTERPNDAGANVGSAPICIGGQNPLCAANPYDGVIDEIFIADQAAAKSAVLHLVDLAGLAQK